MVLEMNSSKSSDKEALRVAREHSGGIGVLTIALALLVFSAYVSVLVLFAGGNLNSVATTFLIGILTFVSYTPMHEAAHGNISGAKHNFKWINTFVGELMSPLIAIPYNSHKHEHYAHHRHTNGVDDPDVHIEHLFRSPSDFVRCNLKVIKTHNTYLLDNRTRAEISVSIIWRAIYVFSTGFLSAPVLILGWYLGAFLNIFLLSYLPHKPYIETARWKNTNIQLFGLELPGYLMFHHNLHAIHHLFPRVPFYNYRSVFGSIEPTLRKNGTPIIGMLNREPI